MRRDTLTAVVCVVLILLTGIVQVPASQLIDDFNQGNDLNDWTEDTAEFDINRTVVYEGNGSVSGVAPNGSNFARIDKQLDREKYDNISVSIYTNTYGDDFYPRVAIQDDNQAETVASIVVDDGTNTGTPGNLTVFDGTVWVDSNINIELRKWYRIRMTGIDFAANTFNLVVYENTTVIGNTTMDMQTDASHADSFALYVNGNGVTNYDYATHNNTLVVGNGDTVETDLELEIDRWMAFNSTQKYTVILNETNTTSGHTTLTDVTENASVFSNNTAVVSVNNTTDTLVSHNLTDRTFVNATYDGHKSENVNVTVGNRNMSNIGIMPPSQWIPSFLEVDSTSGGHNIGSPVQWILFIVIIMSVAARMFNNPWAAVGSGMLTAILLWILTFVDLGVVLSTVFVGILLSLMMIRSRRAKGVTVNSLRGR